MNTNIINIDSVGFRAAPLFTKDEKQFNFYDENKMLPVFTAPKTDLVNIENYKYYIDNKVNVIIPKNLAYSDRLFLLNEGLFTAFTVNELKQIFTETPIRSVFKNRNFTYKIAISLDDNILTQEVMDLISIIKNAAPQLAVYKNNISLMVGPVYTSESVKILDDAGVDFIRVAADVEEPQIFTLGVCGLVDITNYANKSCKIIVETNNQTVENICKYIALGADYVMLNEALKPVYETPAPQEYDVNDYIVRIPYSDIEFRMTVSNKFYTKDPTDASQLLVNIMVPNIKYMGNENIKKKLMSAYIAAQKYSINRQKQHDGMITLRTLLDSIIECMHYMYKAFDIDNYNDFAGVGANRCILV